MDPILSKPFSKIVCILLLLFTAGQIVFAEEIVLTDGCSLADAITAANTNAAVGACPAGERFDTIRLTGDIVLQAALPRIDSDIAIAGDGYTIDGAGKHHLLIIEPFGALRIRQLNVINCYSEQGYSAITGLNRAYITIDDSHFRGNSSDYDGGVIYATHGTIKIRNSIFEDNSAQFAGAIYNRGPSLRPSDLYGTTEIGNVTFKNNRARSGGAIGIHHGKLRIWDSNFTSNVVEGAGGAIANRSGHIDIKRSIFAANKAGAGGAITSYFGSLRISGSSFTNNIASYDGGAISLLDGEVSLSDTTFANNEAAEGGAIYGYAVPSLTLWHVSMVNNDAEEGGGILLVDDPEFDDMLHLHNSLVAGNSGGDCAAVEYENIGSWIGDGSCGALLQGEPMLADMVSATDNATAYLPPQRNSPLIDRAFPTYCTETDQLGIERPQGLTCDIGAIEFVPPTDAG